MKFPHPAFDNAQGSRSSGVQISKDGCQKEPTGPQHDGSPPNAARNSAGETMAATPDLMATVCQR